MKELTPGKIEALKRSAAGQQGKFQIADFRFQIPDSSHQRHMPA
jgi:hypothetical protein